MKIVVYSTSTCTTCVVLERWLEAKGFPYQKKITDTNESFMTEFMKLNDGMISVPFTLITDAAGVITKISGFDRGKLENALGLA